MPLETAASCAFRAAGTLESKSWNGARPVPPFASVPMKFVPPSLAPPATATAYLVTEEVRPLVTLDKKTEQNCGALRQPSVSTQSTDSLPLDDFAAAAEPRPVPPATGKTTSAP